MCSYAVTANKSRRNFAFDVYTNSLLLNQIRKYCLSFVIHVNILKEMGNTGSNKRDRLYSSESESSASPYRDDRAFEFGTGARQGKLLHQLSLEEYDDVPAVFQIRMTQSHNKVKRSVVFGMGKIKKWQQNHLGIDRVSDSNSRTASVSIAPYEYEIFPTVFKWDGGGKEVFISGTFSDWKPIPMVESHGDFALIVDVPEGEHQYKFLVDGQWKHSSNQTTVDNEMGTKNNLVSIKRSDYEVFQALADDSSASNESSAVCASTLGPFTQEIPQRKLYESSVRPPVLPPHLLEVILNKEVSHNIEPTLLPMPNHVMVNHLYALSIKDGVMVLSATLRFRKKYVTTVLYKPI